MNKKLSYTVFFLISCILGFAGSETAGVPELLTSIENAMPARLRDPLGIVENESWTRHPDFKKLQSLIVLDWENHTPVISKIAPSDNAKTIYYKAAQVLDPDIYLKLIMATSDRMAAKELHPMQFKWVVFPHEKHLRNMWIQDPPSDELKKVAARVREVMSDDSGMVSFMTDVIDGKVAANNRNFHPDVDPLHQKFKPPTSPSVTPSPTPAVPPPAAVPAAPQPRSINPVWWIVGAIAALAAVVFVARRKKPKA